MAPPLIPKAGTTAPQRAAVAMLGVGLLGQFVPLDEEAKTNIVYLVTSGSLGTLAADAYIRGERSKLVAKARELFLVDHDGDPKTPPVLTSRLWLVLGVAVAWAVASTVALILTLI